MVWIGADPKAHPVPSSHHGQGNLPVGQAAQSPTQPAAVSLLFFLSLCLLQDFLMPPSVPASQAELRGSSDWKVGRNIRELLHKHQVWSKCFCCCLAVCRSSASLELWFSPGSGITQRETSWEWVVHSSVPGKQCRNSLPLVDVSIPSPVPGCDSRRATLTAGASTIPEQSRVPGLGVLLLQRAQRGTPLVSY